MEDARASFAENGDAKANLTWYLFLSFQFHGIQKRTPMETAYPDTRNFARLSADESF
jgi:hypothetical protein